MPPPPNEDSYISLILQYFYYFCYRGSEHRTSHNDPTGAGFLNDKAAGIGVTMKETPCNKKADKI
jgi:hypothetical protein